MCPGLLNHFTLKGLAVKAVVVTCSSQSRDEESEMKKKFESYTLRLQKSRDIYSQAPKKLLFGKLRKHRR